MYAVIKTGGKQYIVEKGAKLRVEKIDGEPGQKVEFKPLMIKKDRGNPVFGKGKVVGEILKTEKGKKVTVFKYRPKKNYKRWKGHRQIYTEILIKEIQEG